jgi:hypothetical protein
MDYRPLPSIPPTAPIPLKEVSGGILEGGEMINSPLIILLVLSCLGFYD